MTATPNSRPNSGGFVKFVPEQNERTAPNSNEAQVQKAPNSQPNTPNRATEQPGVFMPPEGGLNRARATREGQQPEIPAMTHHQKARLPAIYALLEKFDWLDDVQSLIAEIRAYSNGLGSSPAEILAWGELVYPQLKDEDLEGRWLHAAMAKAFANPAAERAVRSQEENRPENNVEENHE